MNKNASQQPKQWKAFREWLNHSLGNTFLDEEAKQVGELTTRLFGHYSILIGEPQFSIGLNKNPIPTKIWIHPYVEGPKFSAIVARQDKLPINSDEAELVYLAHSLEFLPNPHETLREAYRILKPEGHVLISCFNPWSLWGLYRGLTHYINRMPWDGHSISVFRLKDWLALLGFDLIEIRSFFFRPPLQNKTWLQRLQWLEKMGRWCWPFGAGGYIILAKKRVMTLTPLRASWKTKERPLAPVAEVSSMDF